MSKVKSMIIRDGPVTKVAEFWVRERRYAINVDYLKTVEQEQWFLRVVSGMLSEIDERAATQTQHSMQAKLRELIGLSDERSGFVFGEPVHVSKTRITP